MTRLHRVLAGTTTLLVALLTNATAQSAGANTGGVARLAQERQLAGNWRRVLMIGAHPDDEDTQLLTVLARGQGIQTAYLSLTRGDGGQNLIGPELGELLGVLRTEEMASARAIDGAQQFYTRAFDFGFSKNAEETLAFWGRDSVLKDMVRVIRRFRPQVIISAWQGTPEDGHGHHTAAGILSLEAFHAAGNAARFPELQREGLAPWQTTKFYRLARSGGGATLTFDAGQLDAALGMSYRQIAVRSRSQHRSQNQGALEELGPARSGVRLEERIPASAGRDDSLFAGVVPEALPVDDAHATEALLIERGIVLDATTDDDEVAPHQILPVTLRVWNTGKDTAFIRPSMVEKEGFTERGDHCPGGPQVVAPGQLFSCVYDVTVQKDAPPSTPYYLERDRKPYLYDWTGVPAEVRGEPSSPPLQARFTVSSSRLDASTDVHVRREVEARFRDPVLGEVRRPVMIVPAITLDMQPAALLWTAGRRTHEFEVALEHLSRDTSDALISIAVPNGWATTPAQQVHFTVEGERATAKFTVTAPLNVKLGRYTIAAQAVVGSDTLSAGLYRIRYPHIRARNVAMSASAVAVVADVKFPPLKAVGYVRGGGDAVPDALANAGLHVVLLTGDSLERASLAPYKVIVIGPRAYEADQSLVRANPRLMQWLNAGGTLIIEYQQTPYTRGGFEPRPLTIVQPTASRVTDENALVTILAPTNVALRSPNVIGAADFSGWVQERGLDFPTQWDAAWTPLLEMHDPGDTPRAGGLLVAHVGRGIAVYTGLSFHRELPALVPGAWRLFANLLALGQPTKAATAH